MYDELPMIVPDAEEAVPEGAPAPFVDVTPKTGRVALFQHKIRHEGRAVEAGIKYALRTDALYRGERPLRFLCPPFGASG